MLEFIIANWLTILIIAAVLIYIICLIIKGKWTKIRELAYAFMLRAEKVYRENNGEEKFNLVFNALYSSLPKWMQLFIKPENIKVRLQEWYDIAMDFLDDGLINNSQ